ncbi:MAG: glycerophosphodiester phosphodiesterase [Propionivibrio sp.]|uniref:Glycerophosphodiester phosphodiesterase n=1 Tax=Candidatus Propionivibrio dominans TaxID=2954373 RepID=A0A9D7FDN9_9RHOO|nr:glycerophosphodiester phosphodiesterase [Candidatus Propionivibrio dominans]
MRPAPEWPLPSVFAHRCGGALAPENTLAGLRIAASMGVQAVEFDVMLSADGSPWLIHDETLERTTNGRGRVCDTPDRVLHSLDAGGYQHRAFAGEPLPTLEAAAACCRELGLMANIEIKPASGFEALTGEVVTRRILELWQGAPLPLVSSFSQIALETARRLAPKLPIGYLCVRVPADWLRRLDSLAAFSLHCAASELDDSIRDAANAVGIPVLCYTVNDRQLAASLFERGVTSVFSDRIDLLTRM